MKTLEEWNGFIYIIPITSLPWSSSSLPGSLRSEQSKPAYCIGFVAKLFLPLIDGISFKSKRSSPKRTTPCTRHDVTMVDECNQGTPTWNTRVNKDFQMENLSLCNLGYCLCVFSNCYLRYVSWICEMSDDKYAPRADRLPYQWASNKIYLINDSRQTYRCCCTVLFLVRIYIARAKYYSNTMHTYLPVWLGAYYVMFVSG